MHQNKPEYFGEMLHQSWLLKKSLTKNISNNSIDEIYKKGMTAGASGGKVLGAGGGGFILFYCEPKYQQTLRKEFSELKEFPFNFESEGSKIIYFK